MREELKKFKEKFEGQDVFIIGGGASIKDFDFSKLENKLTVVLNSSIERVKYCSAIFWTDYDWGSQNLEKLAKFDAFKFSVRQQCDHYITNNIKGIANSIVLKKISDYGFSTNINHVAGNNSGAQALNLIINIKPHRVFLLGYDMKITNGQSHCHNQYIMSNPSIYKDLFIPSINSMADHIHRLGIEVINCNIKSDLDCFKKESLEKYL